MTPGPSQYFSSYARISTDPRRGRLVIPSPAQGRPEPFAPKTAAEASTKVSTESAKTPQFRAIGIDPTAAGPGCWPNSRMSIRSRPRTVRTFELTASRQDIGRMTGAILVALCAAAFAARPGRQRHVAASSRHGFLPILRSVSSLGYPIFLWIFRESVGLNFAVPAQMLTLAVSLFCWDGLLYLDKPTDLVGAVPVGPDCFTRDVEVCRKPDHGGTRDGRRRAVVRAIARTFRLLRFVEWDFLRWSRPSRWR